MTDRYVHPSITAEALIQMWLQQPRRLPKENAVVKPTRRFTYPGGFRLGRVNRLVVRAVVR